MLSSDLDTVQATRLLFEEIGRGNNPVTIWAGAGTSAWCGYLLWPELAKKFHSKFARYEKPHYGAKEGLALLNAGRFPELFQKCREANTQRYNSLLTSSFVPRQPTAVYQRFVRALNQIEKLACVLTTNVDELLEKSLPNAATVSRKDLERAFVLLKQNQPFVCKLHGSISDIESTVFTSDDYDELIGNEDYIVTLERILASTSVVFVGYGLQDEHILSILRHNHDLAKLFGDGPHFAIVPQKREELPPSVRTIEYRPQPHKDHRTSISVLEELGFSGRKHKQAVPTTVDADENKELRSAHLLFDILPPGTWTSSQTVELTKDASGEKRQLVVGTGFSNAELDNNRSTAMHDILVGLLCFDELVAPIQAMGRLHDLIGSDRFWALVREDVLKLINWTDQEAVIFPDKGSVASGSLCSTVLFNPDQTKKSIGEAIRKQLKPTAGKEEAAEKLFSELEPKIREISPTDEGSIPDLVRGLLLRPSIRKALGISGGTPLGSLARWQVFPVLRLCNVVKIGAACRVLALGSAKLDFGTSVLAGPAFAAATGAEWADETASYVVCGRFDADLGGIVLRDPTILDAVIAFRDTQAGVSLRGEVLSRLAASEGAEVNVAVNSALTAGVPNAALQQAHDQFVGLLVVSEPTFNIARPAIWNDKRYSQDALGLWRRRSLEILQNYCSSAKVGPYDPCPCGSGESLKFCCEEALQG